MLTSLLRAASARAGVALRIAGGSALVGSTAALAYTPTESKAAPGGSLVLSGDCGGTNTRLALYRIPDGVKAENGKMPTAELVLSKHYRNAENTSITACFTKFLGECDKLTGGERPQTACLACAGGIKNNSVTFTNVADGWTIDGAVLSKQLNLPKVKLINDFEAQGYGLLTLGKGDTIKLNNAEPTPGAPIACVGAGTGLGECFLTCGDDGVYTCWPSEGGHAEFSPRSELTAELIHHLRSKLAFDTAGSPEKMKEYFKQWDKGGDGVINFAEFEAALRKWDIDGIKPKRVSVERVVSGPGLASVYGFLRTHWSFVEDVSPRFDTMYVDAPNDKRGAIVAKCAAEGNKVCKKAVSIFNECYGSEVGVAALKMLPYGGLYISGGIAAKNPDWINSKDFLDAYQDKGRMSNLVMKVPLYLVLTEETGERGALFYAVQMLDK